MITLALLLLTAPASASFEKATAAATDAYRADFQAEHGLAAPDPLGFFLESEEDEILSTVYFVKDGALAADVYGCHSHGPEEFDCHREDRKQLGAYERSTSLYSAAEMRQSVPLALEFFAGVAPGAEVTSLKLWEAQENIRYVVGYRQNGQTKTYFLACHRHGAGIDCHRKRDAGPGQPGSGQ